VHSLTYRGTLPKLGVGKGGHLLASPVNIIIIIIIIIMPSISSGSGHAC